jgi:outer membrane protein TolC
MMMPALLVAATLMTAADAKDTPAKEVIEESTKKIKELQKERIATLKEVVEQAATLYKSARVSYEEVLDARMQLLKAEVDAAEKESDRITLYKKTIDALKQYEEWAQARVEAGRETAAALLKIKARRLEVEIKLEQAKIKEAKEKK